LERYDVLVTANLTGQTDWMTFEPLHGHEGCVMLHCGGGDLLVLTMKTSPNTIEEAQ
jgi:hypothetical protein